MEDRPWSDLPSELLQVILSRLPLPYHPSFSAVCKSWRDVTFRVYPADISPLLVYFKRWGDGILHCYSPSLNKSFRVSSPLDLSECELYSSKDGWLVLYREHEVILANPVASLMRNFPGLPFLNSFSGIAFSGRPPHKCTIFAIDSMFTSSVEISIWRPSRGWVSNIRYGNDYPFVAAPYSSPAVHNGRFYCLGVEGNLGVFNPKRATWKVLASPKSFAYKPEESYLVESKGKLLAVHVGNHNPPVRVVSLNEAEMVWERVITLSSATLFAGPGVSLVTTNRPKRMKNKVLVSRLIGKPETIEAEIRRFEGRAFFVPKQSSQQTPGEGRKQEATEKPGVCCYSLRALKSSGYRDSIWYPCSIWYEPRTVMMSKLRFKM
ncbi:F-box/kelch-repeat protein At1g57790-like isoform X2 [Asparagus officinalis]|nr:F-box/kelch-repeat protein At1g57790-like isoform X2 [Asparagus officinalis]XP_020250762.1 F-box/kelch-repeat protein At1g57790-like isoform X2 [Asparagus officinalis]